MTLFDFWCSVASAERTSHILLQTLFKATSVVEPIGVQRRGFSKLLEVQFRSIGKERLFGAVEKDDVLCESQIEIVLNEILEADAAFGGSQLIVETRKLVYHQAWKTFNEVLDHFRLLFLDLGFVEAEVLVVLGCPHLVLNVLSQIHDILQKNGK